MAATVPRLDPLPFVARHVAGLFASSQASLAVMLHAAWILLLVIALLIPQELAGAHSASQSLGRVLLRLLEWIGAMDREGTQWHADLGTVARGLARLTPVIYLGRLLLARLRRGRPAWTIARKALLSGAIAAAGYGTALALLPAGAWSGLWGVGLAAVVLTGLATLWALLVRALCDALLRGAGLAAA